MDCRAACLLGVVMVSGGLWLSFEVLMRYGLCWFGKICDDVRVIIF